MNILLITHLYPSLPAGEAEDVTLAVHHWVKIWRETENILVVRPVFVYLREVFSRRRVPHPPPLRPYVIERDNVPILVYPVFKIPKVAYYFAPLYRYVDKYLDSAGMKPDLVLAHFDKSLILGYGYSLRRNLPLAVGLHSAPDLSAAEPGAFVKRCGKILARASLIACRSAAIRDRVSQWLGYGEKSFVAVSGISESLIKDQGFAIEKLRRWRERKDGENRIRVSICTACTLLEQKKVALTLKALNALPVEVDWRFTVIGSGPERENLEEQAAELGLTERVIFKGHLPHEEVMNIFEQTDIFIMVSHMESFGLVYIEAMAKGCIVIGSKGTGIDGFITDGVNGYLSPVGDAQYLGELLEKIILHIPTAELEKIPAASMDTIQRHTAQNAAQFYLNKLKQMIGDK